jgi:hypothetical protein
MSDDGEWYWCLRHGRVEEREGCRADDRLGPYPTPQAARNWRERVESRNERWDDADERWQGR